MNKSCFFRIISLPVILFFSVYLYPQDTADNFFSAGIIPELLLTPMRGEVKRYPRDMVIGELGQGTAPDGAWRLAQETAAALVSGNRSSPVFSEKNSDFLKRSFEALDTIESRTYHLGGGRTEADGTISFLLRFLGRDQWVVGELYLRFEEEKWYLDDLVLEEGQDLEEGKKMYTYDFSPYERFY